MSKAPTLYKLTDLAEATGLSIVHFRRMCNTGELKAIKARSGPTSPWLLREDCSTTGPRVMSTKRTSDATAILAHLAVIARWLRH